MKKRCCLAVAISIIFLLFLLFVFAATPYQWVECKSSCLTYNKCRNTGSGAPCCEASDSLINYNCCYEVGVYKWKDSACCAATETICNDGIDNDCDNYIDCADANCAQGSVSQNGFCCGSGCSTNGGTCADAPKSGFICTDNNCNTYGEACRVSPTGELESTLVCSGTSLSCSGGSCESNFGASAFCDEKNPGDEDTTTDECCYGSCSSLDCDSYDDTTYTDNTIAESEVTADSCTSSCSGASCCSITTHTCDSDQGDGFYNCQDKSVEGTAYYCKYGASGFYIDTTSAKPAEICSDGIDNDCDTLTDCQDTNDCHGQAGPSNSICCQSSTTATDCSSLTTGNCGERMCNNNLCDVAKNTGLCPATTGTCGVFANSCSQSSGAYYCNYIGDNNKCSCDQYCSSSYSCTALTCTQPNILDYCVESTGLTCHPTNPVACTEQYPGFNNCACYACQTCPTTTTGGSKTIGSAICS